MPLSLTETLLVAVLCLLAIGSARAGDATQQEREKEYRATVDRADAHYRSALGACEGMEGSQRDVCFREAKAIYIRATADAKARLGTKAAGL